MKARGRRKHQGKVVLVGAGPGAPDLIAMRGADALSRADVVIYDYLVSPEVLRLAPNNPVAQRQLGILYFDQGQLRQAFPLLKRAADGEPNNLDLQLKLVRACGLSRNCGGRQ